MIHVSTTLSDAVVHVVSFLTRPLILSSPPQTLTRLQSVLAANLTSFYSPMWDPKDPQRYADRRCLTLSPKHQPPAPIHSACLAAGIQWSQWAKVLGAKKLDFFVNPGCVYMRETDIMTGETRMVNVWAGAQTSSHGSKKTVAQLILEDDKEEDDSLFARLAEEVSAPVWNTPVAAQFPSSVRSTSPMSIISSHSRSSSYSSDSAYSESLTSASSRSSGQSSPPKLSRRERANRVYVDTSKTEVTVYEAANTSVLSGGTMLGGPARSAPSKRRA